MCYLLYSFIDKYRLRKYADLNKISYTTMLLLYCFNGYIKTEQEIALAIYWGSLQAKQLQITRLWKLRPRKMYFISKKPSVNCTHYIKKHPKLWENETLYCRFCIKYIFYNPAYKKVWLVKVRIRKAICLVFSLLTVCVFVLLVLWISEAD